MIALMQFSTSLARLVALMRDVLESSMVLELCPGSQRSY